MILGSYDGRAIAEDTVAGIIEDAIEVIYILNYK